MRDVIWRIVVFRGDGPMCDRFSNGRGAEQESGSDQGIGRPCALGTGERQVHSSFRSSREEYRYGEELHQSLHDNQQDGREV